MSERARAAASSIASGTPSSRRHSSATRGDARPAVAASRAPAARARSSKRRVAGAPCDVGRVGARGQRERTEHEQRARRRRRAARGWSPAGAARGAAARSSRAEPRRRAEHVLAVVEHEQRGRVAEAEDERVERREAELAGDLGADVVARRDLRRARRRRTPAGQGGELARADLLDEARLAHAAGPDDRHEAPARHPFAELLALRLASEEMGESRHPAGTCHRPGTRGIVLAKAQETLARRPVRALVRATRKSCRNVGPMRQPLILAASLAILAVAGCAQRAALPPGSGYGPNPALPPPEPTTVPTIEVAPAKGWPAGAKPTPAPGLAVDAFAIGLDHPRWLHVLPERRRARRREQRAGEGPGRACAQDAMKQVKKRAGSAVPSANRITLLRDADGDGKAELRETFLGGLHSPFGMALAGGDALRREHRRRRAVPVPQRRDAHRGGRAEGGRPSGRRRSIITGRRT